MNLSEKRKQAIYSAVGERIMQLRIDIARKPDIEGTKLGVSIDCMIARAMDDAASAAVRAAEGKS